MEQIEWRPIPGYEGLYEASSDGRVRAVRAHPKGRTPAGHVLAQQMAHNGYLNVGLWKDGGRKVVGVHRLVAAAFHGAPAAGMEASHGDGEKTNNAAANLRWALHADNELDKREHGTQYSHFKGRAACSKGHEYTPETTYVNSGRRHCRTCQTERAAARREGERQVA